MRFSCKHVVGNPPLHIGASHYIIYFGALLHICVRESSLGCVCVSVSVVYMCACHVSVCNHVCYCVYVGRKELCHRTTETLIALVLDTCTH